MKRKEWKGVERDMKDHNDAIVAEEYKERSKAPEENGPKDRSSLVEWLSEKYDMTFDEFQGKPYKYREELRQGFIKENAAKAVEKEKEKETGKGTGKGSGRGNRTNHATLDDEVKRSAKITISCTQKQLEAIQRYAGDEGKSVTAFLLELVDGYEKKMKKKQKQKQGKKG